MKLRLYQNTARLRLDRNDVARLGAEGRVVGETRFGPASHLTYTIEVAPAAEEVSVRAEADGFTVLVPGALAREWVETDRVGFTCEHPVSAEASLRVSVEKDFQCLHQARPGDTASYPYSAQAPATPFTGEAVANASEPGP